MSKGLVIRVGEEPDGEGWFECLVCGVWPGFETLEVAREEADMHTEADCAEELAWNAP